MTGTSPYASSGASPYEIESALPAAAPAPEPPAAQLPAAPEYSAPPQPVASAYPVYQAYPAAYPPPTYPGYPSYPGYPGGFQPAYAQMIASTQSNSLGVVSLILSLVGMFVLPIGLVSIGGVVFGHLGLAAANKGRANNNGMSLAGLIVGYVGAAIQTLFIGLVVFAMIAGDPA